MAGLRGELLEILQLGAAVSFTERVDVVDVADDDGRLFREVGWRQVPQDVAANEAAVNVSHSGLDVLPELELLFALADLDGAQFAGPVIDVLEQMAMDRAQMGQIERSARYSPSAPQNDKGPLLLVKECRIGDPEQIS